MSPQRVEDVWSSLVLGAAVLAVASTFAACDGDTKHPAGGGAGGSGSDGGAGSGGGGGAGGEASSPTHVDDGSGGGATSGGQCDPAIHRMCINSTDVAPVCELREGDSDPCHQCAVERCCFQPEERGLPPWEPGCWRDLGRGEVEGARGCFEVFFPPMQTCFEGKLAASPTAESIDLIGECMCELWYLTPSEIDGGLVCHGPRDPNPGNDSPPAHFIACLTWPAESDWGEDAGTEGGDAGASEVTNCAEVCFPGWR